MSHALVPTTITIADITFSYEDLIISSGLASASSNMSKQYAEKYPDAKQAARHLIRSFKLKYICTGLASNLPDDSVTSPTKKAAAAAGVILDILMCLSVASLAGFDATDDEVKAFVMSNSLISVAAKALQPYAIEFGNHLSDHLIDCIPQESIQDINGAVGYRAITKRGETGTINLDDWAWLGGVALGVGTDFLSSSVAGWRAYHTFFKKLRPSSIDVGCTEKDATK